MLKYNVLKYTDPMETKKEQKRNKKKNIKRTKKKQKGITAKKSAKSENKIISKYFFKIIKFCGKLQKNVIFLVG